MAEWDAPRFLRDYRIQFETVSQRTGWVNISCPMCTDRGMHGGIKCDEARYHCWKCGGHRLERVIGKLLGLGPRDAVGVFQAYTGRASLLGRLNRAEDAPKRATAIDLPGGPLGRPHRDYLEGRDFDPDLLADRYSIRGTGPKDKWQGAYFGNRIIIPIHDRAGRLVSFQGRDITGESKIRYKGCPLEQCVLDYKHLLYGANLVKGGRVGVVEGVFDQWRLGPGFVATFGTSMTQHQLKALGEFREIVFLFDPEPEAQAKARRYASALAAAGRTVELANLELGEDRDPGDLSEQEAAEVRRELGF